MRSEKLVLITLVFSVMLAGIAQCQTKEVVQPYLQPDAVIFLDVPQDHWGFSSVYDALRMGLVQGYPDGTFRGNKRITRYETAMFMKRLLAYLAKRAEEQKQLTVKKYQEHYEPKLRAELGEIKKEIEKLREPEIPRPEYGYFEGRVKLGNFTSISSLSPTGEVPAGPRFDPRLKMSFDGWLNKWLCVEAHLDTMDGLWGGAPVRKLVTEMIDISGRVKTPSGIGIFFTSGAGPVVHTEEASSPFPSQNGIVFMRPRNSFGATGNVFGLDWLTSYSALMLTRTGEASMSNYSMKLGHDFDEDRSFLGIDELSTTLDYNVRHGSDPADVFKEKFTVVFRPKWGFEFGLSGGFSSIQSTGGNYFYATDVKFKNPFGSRFDIEFSGTRVGAEYLNFPEYLAEESMLGLNFLDKYRGVPGGGADLGLRVTHDASESFRLIARGNVVLDDEMSYGEDYPGTSTTFEIELDYLSYTYATIGVVYTIYHEPSRDFLPTTDMLTVLGRYAF